MNRMEQDNRSTAYKTVAERRESGEEQREKRQAKEEAVSDSVRHQVTPSQSPQSMGASHNQLLTFFNNPTPPSICPQDLHRGRFSFLTNLIAETDTSLSYNECGAIEKR